MEEIYTKNGWQQTTQKNFKLQTWKEKKYRKTTNEMGRWFPVGRNRPRALSLIVDDDKLYFRNFISKYVISQFHFTWIPCTFARSEAMKCSVLAGLTSPRSRWRFLNLSGTGDTFQFLSLRTSVFKNRGILHDFRRLIFLFSR